MISTLISISFLIFSVRSNELNEVYYSPSSCDSQAENKIIKCSEELSTMGVFSSTNKQTLASMKKHSQFHFVQMCAAYQRYNTCLGGNDLKYACYPYEPMKSKYSVVDKVLEYVCGEGYESMLNNWNCYLSVADSSEIETCEQSFTSLARNTEQMYNDYSLTTAACFALQSYVDCIRPSIEQTCGLNSYLTVIQAVERPVQVYLPYCTLSASSSSILMAFILICASIF